MSGSDLKQIRKGVLYPFLFVIGISAQACGISTSTPFTSPSSPGLSLEDATQYSEYCDDQQDEVTYSRNLNVICVRGRITEELSNRFIELASKANPKYAHIYSEGGLMHAALDMAESIDVLNIDVIVGDRCFSSCAQFLFIAGEAKYLLPNSILAFHGGPIPDSQIDSADIEDDQKATLKRLQDRFRAFYKEREISMDIVSKPPRRIQEQINAGDQVFWTWTASELSRFGVNDIIDLK